MNRTQVSQQYYSEVNMRVIADTSDGEFNDGVGLKKLTRSVRLPVRSDFGFWALALFLLLPGP